VLLHGALLVLAVLLCYVIALGGPFLWDDEVTIVGNSLIRSWSSIPQIFVSSLFGERMGGIGFYRPLATLSYLFDYQLFGLSAFGFHLTSIILHAANALLVYALLLRFDLRYRFAFIGALFFAVHPVQIEAVTYISGRNDLLFLLFSLLTILTFLSGMRGKPLAYIFSVLCFALALLSKENAVVVPVLLIPLVWLERKKAEGRLPYLTLALLLLVSVAYAVFRFVLINQSSTGTLSWIAEATLFERFLTVPHALFQYVLLLLVPFPLHMEYQFVETSPWNLWLWMGMPLLLAGIGAGIAFVRQRFLASALFFWFFVSLLPVLNFPVATPSTLREHWLYLPSVGAFALIALILQRYDEGISPSARRLFLGVCVCVALVFGALTIQRNQDWLSPLRLYAHDVQWEPKSFLLWNNLGVEQYRRGDRTAAKESFLQAVAMSPGERYSMAHNNLAVMLEQEGNVSEAVRHFSLSIDLTNERLAYQNLSRILLRLDDIEEAMPLIEKGLSLYPDDSELLSYRSAVQRLQAETKKADRSQ